MQATQLAGAAEEQVKVARVTRGAGVELSCGVAHGIQNSNYAIYLLSKRFIMLLFKKDNSRNMRLSAT
jgi:hypothetical protein